MKTQNTPLLYALLFGCTFFQLQAFEIGFADIDANVHLSGCLGEVNIPDVDNVCSALDAFKTSYGNDFSIGGCSIGVKTDVGCLTDNLSSLCKGIVGSSVMTPIQSSLVDYESFELLKGDAFKRTDTCNSEGKSKKTTYPSGATKEEVDALTTIDNMHGEYGIYSSEIDTVRDCMKINSSEDCLKKDFLKLPETSLETEKIINRGASKIASADASVVNSIATLQAQTAKKVEKCKGVQECISATLSEDDSPDALLKKEHARIEMASSLELGIMEKATKGDTYFVYKDKESIMTLPIEVHNDYFSGVSRQNAADVLVKSLYKEIVDLKKESVTANYGTVNLLSATYHPAETIDTLKQALDFLAEQSSKSE